LDFYLYPKIFKCGDIQTNIETFQLLYVKTTMHRRRSVKDPFNYCSSQKRPAQLWRKIRDVILTRDAFEQTNIIQRILEICRGETQEHTANVASSKLLDGHIHVDPKLRSCLTRMLSKLAIFEKDVKKAFLTPRI
jgi:hypothetical protein